MYCEGIRLILSYCICCFYDLDAMKHMKRFIVMYSILCRFVVFIFIGDKYICDFAVRMRWLCLEYCFAISPVVSLLIFM
jgi:hypothetical protein